MPFRDDLDAATARRDALTRELDQVQQRLREHEPLQQRARELADQLDDAQKNVDHARRRVSLPMLGAVTVSTPCKEPWDRMAGDDRVRFCGRCEKNVFNLTAMTADEAEDLLRERGGGLCVRFFRRPDGTVLTSDCPVGARTKRRRRMVVTAVAVVAGAVGAVWALVPRDSPPPPPPEAHMMGAVEVAPTPPEPELEPFQGGVSSPMVAPLP